MASPEVLVAAVGLFASTAAYLAGRNRWLVKAAKDLVESYEQLIKEFRLEIDRLKGEVAELRELLSAKRTTRTKS